MKCIKKCYILNAMDGTDDDILWNDSEDGDIDTNWSRQIESDMFCI